ncbi:MAG TPA: hypothetical protein PKV78_04670 [Methanoculleus thermophilus]|nr:hypothetical protein [Methanoculleus thermophilus]
MVKDQEIKDARDAHRRKLARACRPKRSGDEDSTILREHRKTHKYNLLHESRFAAPKPEFKAQQHIVGDTDE